MAVLLYAMALSWCISIYSFRQASSKFEHLGLRRAWGVLRYILHCVGYYETMVGVGDAIHDNDTMGYSTKRDHK